MQGVLAPRILPGPGVHRPAGLPLPPPGLPGQETPRQLQRGQAHHLQHADLLRRVGVVHPSSRQFSGEVHGCRGDLRHPGVQLWTPPVYLCAQVLHHPAEA